jgi:DNA mismatch repair ATPase MutS
VSAIERERKEYLGNLSNYPGWVLAHGIRVLEIFLEQLTLLRKIADNAGGAFESEGFRRFFQMLREELGEDFFAEAQDHLKRLRFRTGVPISGRLGKGLKGTGYVLRRSEEGRLDWIGRLFAPSEERGYTFHLQPRDEAGARCLGELRDRGINLVADALGKSADHVLAFFRMLRTELAFFLGCANLKDALEQSGQPTCFPKPMPPGEACFSCKGLYDATLALSLKGRVVGNDVESDGNLLVVITGANQGGKSTFLRSVGLAHLMMQCGMIVPAAMFSASVCDGLFTHYKREEDTSMTSGKLDEEMSRMSVIVDHMTPHALLLLNESFASTNEREGSEISRQIVRGLIDQRERIFFVTHLYELAHGLYERQSESATFLRADRNSDGQRTFKLVPGEPLQTSFGQDLYERIFAA